ncbi:MAG: hypothetical protein ABJO27_14195 [Pseudoruegeria sp.]
MSVSLETATKIAFAHREIETAKSLLEQVESAVAQSSFDQKDIRDTFGARQNGLQLGVPSSPSSQRIFNVPFSMCRPIIEAHIENQKTIIKLYSEKAGIEALGDNGQIMPTITPLKSNSE